MCPDMALMLGPLPRPAAAEVDLFCLMRTDKERAEGAGDPPPGLVADWVGREPPMETRADRLVARLYNRALRAGAPAPVLRMLMRGRLATMNRHAELRLARGLRLLAQGRQVLTDRLHAHILCTLMGIPHVVLDNSYGKIRNVNDSWPPDGLTRTAADMAEARALLADTA
jgi:pyruvyl transferase EpsO